MCGDEDQGGGPAPVEEPAAAGGRRDGQERMDYSQKQSNLDISLRFLYLLYDNQDPHK